MATIKGQLKHGLKAGKKVHKNFTMHDHLTAEQIINAKEAAEKVVPFAVDGRVMPVVVESPAKLGAHMLCQQVGKIGPFTGPLDYELFGTLHQDDLDILNLYADLAFGAITAKEIGERLSKLGVEASPEVTQRGRDDSPGGGAGGDGSDANEKGRHDS